MVTLEKSTKHRTVLELFKMFCLSDFLDLILSLLLQIFILTQNVFLVCMSNYVFVFNIDH